MAERNQYTADASLVTVTPEMAREVLSLSGKVETVPVKVARFVRKMRIGKWRTGEESRPVVIQGGVLMDGFHRLSAVVSLDRAVDLLVENDRNRQP